MCVFLFRFNYVVCVFLCLYVCVFVCVSHNRRSISNDLPCHISLSTQIKIYMCSNTIDSFVRSFAFVYILSLLCRIVSKTQRRAMDPRKRLLATREIETEPLAKRPALDAGLAERIVDELPTPQRRGGFGNVQEVASGLCRVFCDSCCFFECVFFK